jgi:hypothetical protein
MEIAIFILTEVIIGNRSHNYVETIWKVRLGKIREGKSDTESGFREVEDVAELNNRSGKICCPG